MTTAFKNKNMKSECFGIFIMKIFYFRVIEENALFKKDNMAHDNKELIQLGLSAAVVLVCIFV